ncbi:hypothetical protein LTR53_007525 [Teratosphaeriaceae sp. CCFEE 6253]|nr:hypothetical protein LTR53_007525 [Teratosphaeriaceae sp. CCFEE 6253]
MSLKEAYTLAHTAQCRLQLEASRPDRHLRYVVGHLLHYESMRLRIVQIEHDISRSERASAVAFQGTGHVGGNGDGSSGLRHKVSSGQLGRRRSPPPPPVEDGESGSDEEDGNMLDDDEDAGLGLTRFPSGTARPPPPQAPPALEPDNDDDYDDDEDEPVSPEEPDQATLEQALQGKGDELKGTMYNGVRKCPCHGQTGAPELGRMWELPASQGTTKEGVSWAVAEVVGEA